MPLPAALEPAFPVPAPLFEPAVDVPAEAAPELPAVGAPAVALEPAPPSLPPSSLPHAERGNPMLNPRSSDRSARPPDVICELVPSGYTPCNRYRCLASPRDFYRDERRATERAWFGFGR